MAGQVTGLALQRRGVRDVRVVERRPSVQTTLCGEGLSARTLARLRPTYDASGHIAQSFAGARWRFPGTTLWVHHACHTLAREAWVPAMADRFCEQGGSVETGRSVREEHLADLDADVVVGADGPASRVRRAVPGAEVQLRTGLQWRVETDRETDWLEFVTSKRYGREYAWWFPRGRVHNVGVLGEGDGRDRERLQAFCDDLELDGRVVREQAYPIAFGGTRVASRDGRVLLVGDAAGLTNPLTKGGIAATVHASGLLADAVARGRPRLYARRLRRHPLRHRCFGRALGHVRRLEDRRFRELLAHVPPDVHIGGPGPPVRRQAVGAAARTALAHPGSLRMAKPFWDAGRLSLDYSW